MIKVVKRCEFPMTDGFKCKRAFKVSSSRRGRKYCDEHLGNDIRHPDRHSKNKLVNSTNVHAQAANDITMREWVMDKIKAEKKDEDRMAKLENEIVRLGKLIETSEGNKKKLTSIVKREIKGTTALNVIEGIIVKTLRKSNLRMENMNNELSFIKGRLDILENKNGDEEE